MLPVQLDDYKISKTILLPIKATHVEDNILLNKVVSGHYIDLRGQYNDGTTTKFIDVEFEE